MVFASACGVAILFFVCKSWIHVPSSDPLLRKGATVDEVYNLLGENARAAVDVAREHRTRLSGVRVLRELQPRMSKASATALGIEVLRANVEGDITVGLFEVPAVNLRVIDLPKSE